MKLLTLLSFLFIALLGQAQDTTGFLTASAGAICVGDTVELSAGTVGADYGNGSDGKLNATSGTDNPISKNLDTASCLRSWNLNPFILDLFLHLSQASLKQFTEIGNTNSDDWFRLDSNSIAVLVNGICLYSLSIYPY